MKDRIILELGVPPEFDPAAEAERRVGFLMNYLRDHGCKTYVLGISGGIDSTTSGLLAQEACRRLRSEDYEAYFIAVRLPYGTQKDEDEAQLAIKTINPDQVKTVNIADSTDEMLIQVYGSTHSYEQIFESPTADIDFTKGNIKARQRMIAQYAIAGSTCGLVIGTDHNAEAVMGFFTKFGDGACDLTPLSGLNKRRVRALGKHLGAPDALVNKVPTADLEDLDPGKPDEVAYGVTYDMIDDFLEGKPIAPEAEQKIIDQFSKTFHKRALPVTP